MTEYRYDAVPAEVPAGRVVFRLTNDGEEIHQPTLLILPEDTPPILEQLQGSERRNVSPLANNPGIPRGVAGAVAVDLEPGQRYAFVCLVTTADGQDHSRLGMAWEFRAGGDAAGITETTETTGTTTAVPGTPDSGGTTETTVGPDDTGTTASTDPTGEEGTASTGSTQAPG